MRVLGINAIFHDPAAALVVDGRVVAAAEEERFSRRKHGKRPVPFAAWELPDLSAAWCLEAAGLRPGDLDAVAYSFDPALSRDAATLGLDDPSDGLRVDYARRAPQFLAAALPGLDPERVRFVPHHVAHAASAGLSVPEDNAVLVLDGRGEVASHLAGAYRDGELTVLRTQELPHSLGLLYEDLTRHLGFLHSSDEYKVMALAAYGRPRLLGMFRELVRATVDGGFTVDRVDWDAAADERRQGPRAVPPDRPDGAGRAVRRRLRGRLPEPVHALRAPRETRVARPHPGRHPRRRHRARADRPRRDRAAGRRDAGRVRAAHRPARGGQHLAEHGRPPDGRHPPGGHGAVRFGPDAPLNDPAAVADTVVFALSQPPGCAVREMVVCAERETSYP